MTAPRTVGLAAIALGIGFNVPYAVLAATFDYPQILRQPAAVVLARFAEGGPALVLTWYGFMIAALALVPLAPALALDTVRMAQRPALAMGAAISGALAGIAQAIGLARWVFVVPTLAKGSETGFAQTSFDLLNAYGGVAVGEHMGQLLTALFAAQLAALQRGEGHRLLAALGALSALGIAVGTGEGLALALGEDGGPFSLATIIGFLALSLWLVGTGWQLARSPQEGSAMRA